MSARTPDDLRYRDLTAAQVAFLQQTVPIEAKRSGTSASIETTEQTNGLTTATIHYAALDVAAPEGTTSNGDHLVPPGTRHAVATGPGLMSEANVIDLATILVSEASVGNDVERVSVGFTVLNRLTGGGLSSVGEVWSAYAHGQHPTAEFLALARQLLSGRLSDTTEGATHFYSPRAMPKAGEATAGYDVRGGLELVAPLTTQTYAPSWAKTMRYVEIPGVRPAYYKFYASMPA